MELNPATTAIAAHYDSLDAFYREIWGTHVHHGLWLRGNETRFEAELNLVRCVADKAQIRTGDRVCDIGCGYGGSARWIADEIGAHVTGFTVSAAQFAFATAWSAASGPTHVLGDWLQNDLPDGTFDSAIAIESSEHISDLTAFFAQTRRVLRGGERFVMSTWMRGERVTRFLERHLLNPIARESEMVAFRAISDYQEEATKAGFRQVEFIDITQQVRRTWPAIIEAYARGIVEKPHLLKYLFGSFARNRRFALTILRILAAYRFGALRYYLLSCVA